MTNIVERSSSNKFIEAWNPVWLMFVVVCLIRQSENIEGLARFIPMMLAVYASAVNKQRDMNSIILVNELMLLSVIFVVSGVNQIALMVGIAIYIFIVLAINDNYSNYYRVMCTVLIVMSCGPSLITPITAPLNILSRETHSSQLQREAVVESNKNAILTAIKDDNTYIDEVRKKKSISDNQLCMKFISDNSEVENAGYKLLEDTDFVNQCLSEYNSKVGGDTQW